MCVCVQAMGIYGHMSANSPLKTQPDDGTDDSGEASSADSMNSMEKLKESIANLDKTVDSTLQTDSSRTSSTKGGSEHFSIFDTPTERDGR